LILYISSIISAKTEIIMPPPIEGAFSTELLGKRTEHLFLCHKGPPLIGGILVEIIYESESIHFNDL